MAKSEKVETWDGLTKTHRFSVDFYYDGEQGLFTARIEASTPPLAKAMRAPGQPVARIDYESPVMLKANADLDVLKGTAKATIRQDYGEILQIRDSK